MNPLTCNYYRYLCKMFCIALIVSSTGCGTRATPPGESTISTVASGMNIRFLKWTEGLMVLFVDDVNGPHTSSGSRSTENPVNTSIVSAGAPDAGGYTCLLETKDGKLADCFINEKAYDLSNGTLFVIKQKGERIEVHQLKRDLSRIPFDAKDCRDPIQKDVEIRKLLDLGDFP